MIQPSAVPSGAAGGFTFLSFFLNAAGACARGNMDREANLVTSGFSATITRDGITMELCNFRFEQNAGLALEVVNKKRTPIGWDDAFISAMRPWPSLSALSKTKECKHFSTTQR